MAALHQRIARIFTLTDRSDRQPLCKYRRQILERMNCDVDATIEQRIFKLFSKNALASDHRQGIALHIASSFYDFNTNVEADQAVARLFSLPECEFRTARTDYELSRHSSLTPR